MFGSTKTTREGRHQLASHEECRIGIHWMSYGDLKRWWRILVVPIVKNEVLFRMHEYVKYKLVSQYYLFGSCWIV